MVKRGLVLLVVSAFFLVFLGLNFVSAETFNNCWNKTGTSQGTCEATSGCFWRTNITDPWCINSVGCCMDLSCGMFVGNQAGCTNVSDNLNCTWDSLMNTWYPNGTQGPSGGCMQNSSSGGGGGGGFAEGCWQYDANKASCSSKSNTCKWTANDLNQDPWCPIKSLNDAKNKNPSATTTDIGCCQTLGCWSFDKNQSSCEAAFQGNCAYNSFGGWCSTKSASQITTQANCTYAKQTLFMPYEWNGTACTSGSGGGFTSFNDSDSCFSKGGWYNSTGGCVMPSGNFSGGSGGFMFGGEAHCWFADNKQEVCGNLTGCAYCVAGTGAYGIANVSSNNICYNKQVGFCEGHNTGDTGSYVNANNSANLACVDIKLQSACLYGPLPNCNWINSSAQTGSYCEAGVFSGKKSAPPAQYCEDPVAKNNYTICTQLANTYMMPCKWDNSSYPVKNCTFSDQAVFGTGQEKDFGIINNQFACTSAGGTWNTEYYVDSNVLKQDSWCEMTGLFNIDQNKGQGNKGNCNTNCWACEFQSNGTAWGSVSAAESACTNSSLGYCRWTNDSNSFNKLGRCDFPKEMENGGSKDCNSECEGCNFVNSPQSACTTSMANNGSGCKWVNDTNNIAKGGFCVDKTKKTCSSDCFSCSDFTACSTSTLSCKWDQTFNLCSPNGFTGEVCFDGIDNNQNGLIDCSDPTCGFDNFCGGSAVGGSCFAKTTKGTCNTTVAFGGLNCTWLTESWNPTGWCDMPGANCWKFNDNLTGCGVTPGCINTSSSLGGSSAWCEMNMTKMDNSACWLYNNQSSCGSASSCQWRNNTFGIGGFCEYAPNAACSILNQSGCSINTNCTWKQDNFSSVGGWCDVACFNPNLNQSSCENVALNGLCKWKNMSQTCQPTTFMMMGSSGGDGKKGCPRYDGNQTGCLANNITCTYKNDSFSQNNKSASESSGWCMDKAEYENFGESQGGIIDLAKDSGNVLGAAESGIDQQIDLLGIGMKVNDAGFDFGAGVFNISKGIICNGYTVGSGQNFGQIPTQGNGNATTQFYWYLDTNGNTSDGCAAVPPSGENLTGYNFLIVYTSRNTSQGATETKQLMRCSNGSWFPTNAQISTSKKLGCGQIGGVMIAISKQDLESFSEYSKTSNMKIFMTSANETGSRTIPSDSVGPGYYTPGTVDFGFVDCSNPSNAQNSKCKNFQKFGFNVFEECKNNVDDDENGLIDCNDPFCAYMPDCAGSSAFSFAANLTDKTAPVVVFSEIEKSYDSAFSRIDTNEPSNLSLDFFKNDSTCSSTNLNITLNDTGNGYQSNANFKPFHSVDLILNTLEYSLINNTTYYYKIKVCDPSSNCGVSACSNFTTKSTNVDKSFIFKIDLPSTGNYTVNIPAFNKTNYNFTETFGNQTFDVGIKTNTSITKNINFTVSCGDGGMSIGFFGVNILKPTSIDLSSAFICNESTDLIGMNSSSKKWNKLINDLKLGGATDYLEITVPVAYNASNALNWTDDSGSNGKNVSSFVNCSGDSTKTVCKVPVSMGFSAYTVTGAATTTTTTTTTTSSSSGGGGGDSNSTSWVTIDVYNENETKSGFTKSFAKMQRVRIIFNGTTHYVGIINVSSASAYLNVTSEQQIANLNVGDKKSFELTGDNYDDISVKLNNINGIFANITLTSVHELKPQTLSAASNGSTGNGTTNQNNNSLAGKDDKNKSRFSLWTIIGIIIALVIIVAIILFYYYKVSSSNINDKVKVKSFKA